MSKVDGEEDKRDLRLVRAGWPSQHLARWMGSIDESIQALASMATGLNVFNQKNLNDDNKSCIDLIDDFLLEFFYGFNDWSVGVGARGRREATTILSSQKKGVNPEIEKKGLSDKFKFWKKKQPEIVEG